MKNYTELLVEDKKQKVKFVETLKIAEGVECDVYIFPDDASKDLAIVRIVKGSKSPRQKEIDGVRTLQIYVSGEGKLVVEKPDESRKIYQTPVEKTVEVKIGEIMQWFAKSDLVYYEICYPPYKDGRYINLPE